MGPQEACPWLQGLVPGSCRAAGVWDFTRRAFQSRPTPEPWETEAWSGGYTELPFRARSPGDAGRGEGEREGGVKALPLITQEVCQPTREEEGGLPGGRNGTAGWLATRRAAHPHLWGRPRSSSSQILPRPQQENRKAELGPLLPDLDWRLVSQELAEAKARVTEKVTPLLRREPPPLATKK